MQNGIFSFLMSLVLPDRKSGGKKCHDLGKPLEKHFRERKSLSFSHSTIHSGLTRSNTQSDIEIKIDEVNINEVGFGEMIDRKWICVQSSSEPIMQKMR